MISRKTIRRDAVVVRVSEAEEEQLLLLPPPPSSSRAFALVAAVARGFGGVRRTEFRFFPRRQTLLLQ